MTRWLLAAEADKIQDFVFRSSRLVQVVGGSGLLARFCEEAPGLIIERHTGRRPAPDDEDIIIADGGSFLLAFDDKDIARAVGEDLAEAYYRATEGSLTVACPQKYEESQFREGNQQARRDLRAKKTDRRDQRVASAHTPYTAICASCGISLAVEYGRRHRDDNPNYLCAACRDKLAERDRSDEDFLKTFADAVKTAAQADTVVGETLRQLSVGQLLPRDAEQVGAHDSRRYVAYLVADGNSMGVFFSQCEEAHDLSELSRSLSDAMRTALARATARLADRLWEPDRGVPVPVTPLILGGDDLFALVAAPYALDFARQVCLAFEDEMKRVVDDLQFSVESGYPTMSAAVVVCKQSYPYALAHRQGEALLDRTKALSRAARLKDKVNLSAVSFTLVKGGDVELQGGGDGDQTHILPGLSPYWVTSEPLPDQEAQKYALDLQQLLQARYDLRNLPGKRRAELRELFTAQLSAQNRGRLQVLDTLRDTWRPGLDALLGRLERKKALQEQLKGVLGRLGDPDLSTKPYPWREFDGRAEGHSEKPLAHGLPDVLEMWDFAQDLERGLAEYEEEGA
jgi:hypothetical protein